MKAVLDPTLQKSLNVLLATQSSLYFKTKKAHWLAMGPNFKELHELLDGQAQFVLASIDEIAERITMLRGMPLGSLSEFQQNSLVKDFAPGHANIFTYLKSLLEDHEQIISAMKETIQQAGEKNDPGTEDMLTSLLKEHEKTAWFLRETVEAK